MSRLLNWRIALGLLLLGFSAATNERCAAQQLPPRPIIPLMNNGSLSVNPNPRAPLYASLGQPVVSFIAAAPQDVRLLYNGVPVAIDRIIPALTPGQGINVNVPAGTVTVAGPNPIANIILNGWGAKRRNHPDMGGSTPYWAHNYPSHNPFTSYSGFFPQQSYHESNRSELYALYNLATAIDFQHSQMTPYFGTFSNTSMSSSSSSSAEANPFAAFDSTKDQKPEEAKEKKPEASKDEK